ncbi:GUN4 domain-containing protein [Laspinema olomoucense]|uniref:GUN4 domain-containing protein n=1 Tax=Laspinema olomoucense TaxID=3231600 RepID=UPI0021BA98BF|nr:GUN4 domain-containing protein [Laspinema sp. D3d]MCT7970744.1 GUN4 domain-containing protein [Laspinema sp. D3d]
MKQFLIEAFKIWRITQPITPPCSGKTIKAVALILGLSLQSCLFEQPPKPDPQFQLTSTANIDYKPLQALLREHQWKAADRATFQILLKISQREAEGWLSQTDVEKLACEDLHTLAQLWDYYSESRFGFIQQQKIWESVGGIVGNYTPEIAEKFGDHVGWRRQGQWKTYEQLKFSKSAPEGHLPATTGNGVSGGVWNGVASITHRLKYCHFVDALASQQWVTADWKTLELLDPYREDTRSATASLLIGDIPCSELQEIDRLWLKYSNKRFGLSVQTAFLKTTGNDPKELNWDHYAQFERAVGWSGVHHQEDSYNGVDPQTIPRGHFPYRIGYSYFTLGSGFHRTWRLDLNPNCGFY